MATAKNYTHYTEITKDILDRIVVGDLVRVNDWKRPLRVKGVSENYFVMEREVFGKPLYSVCEKKLWDGIRYNAMRRGMFHVGTDDAVFGTSLEIMFPRIYHFEDEAATKAYLEAFERGDHELSVRTSVPIYDLHIKRAC